MNFVDMERRRENIVEVGFGEVNEEIIDLASSRALLSTGEALLADSITNETVRGVRRGMMLRM